MRFAALIEYDGRAFYGFQRQREHASVQAFMEDHVASYTKSSIILHAAGRTDAGVHALGQVVHFDVPNDVDPMRLKGYLNHHGLPLGVSVIDIQTVSDNFHARFSAQQRSYVYIIFNRQSPSPLWQHRSAWVKTPLNVHTMQTAAAFFVGAHNFDSFRSAHCQATHGNRTLDLCRVESNGDFIRIYVASKSFLHNQVRIMVGSLMHVGQGKADPAWISDLLTHPSRQHAGPTAPPYGLYFKKVLYPQGLVAFNESLHTQNHGYNLVLSSCS